jgi:hypothetical protein
MGSSVHGENTRGCRKRQFGYPNDIWIRRPRNKKLVRYGERVWNPVAHVHQNTRMNLFPSFILSRNHYVHASS